MSSKVSAAGAASSKKSSRPQKNSGNQQAQKSSSSQRSQRSSSASKAKKSGSVKRADSQRFQKTSRTKQAQKPSKLPATQQKNLKNISNTQTKQLSNNHSKTAAVDKSNKNIQTDLSRTKDIQSAGENTAKQSIDKVTKADNTTSNTVDRVRRSADNTPSVAQANNTNNMGNINNNGTSPNQELNNTINNDGLNGFDNSDGFWDRLLPTGSGVDANGLPTIGLRGGDGPAATVGTNQGGNTQPTGSTASTNNTGRDTAFGGRTINVPQGGGVNNDSFEQFNVNLGGNGNGPVDYKINGSGNTIQVAGGNGDYDSGQYRQPTIAGQYNNVTVLPGEGNNHGVNVTGQGNKVILGEAGSNKRFVVNIGDKAGSNDFIGQKGNDIIAMLPGSESDYALSRGKNRNGQDAILLTQEVNGKQIQNSFSGINQIFFAGQKTGPQPWAENQYHALYDQGGGKLQFGAYPSEYSRRNQENFVPINYAFEPNPVKANPFSFGNTQPVGGGTDKPVTGGGATQPVGGGTDKPVTGGGNTQPVGGDQQPTIYESDKNRRVNNIDDLVNDLNEYIEYRYNQLYGS